MTAPIEIRFPSNRDDLEPPLAHTANCLDAFDAGHAGSRYSSGEFMIQTSYISSASPPMSAKELLGLLQQRRENNAGQGVTGMLLYANGTFLQVLEGAEEVIDELVEIIKKDPRHNNIQMLYRKPIERREYSDWTMGFRRLSDKDLRGVNGLRNFGEKDFNPEYLAQHATVVQSLMNHYRKERATAIGHGKIGVVEEDQIINLRHRVIRGAVLVLAALMALTILWGMIDAVVALYSEILRPSFENLRLGDIDQRPLNGPFAMVIHSPSFY